MFLIFNFPYKLCFYEVSVIKLTDSILEGKEKEES